VRVSDCLPVASRVAPVLLSSPDRESAMRSLQGIRILLALLALIVAPLPFANAADAPPPPDKQFHRPSNEGKILSGLEKVCQEQGWGHWWDGTDCLTNEDASKLTREEALDLIRRNFGPHSPLF
jgi:hypothetical protein